MDSDKVKFLSNSDNDHGFRSFVQKMMREADTGNIRFATMYYETQGGEPHLFLSESGDRVKSSGTLHLMATSLENMQIEEYFDNESGSDGEGA